MKIWIHVLVSIAICMACMGCGSGSDSSEREVGGTNVDPNKPLETASPIDCNIVPCSIADVPAAVVARGAEVLRELATRTSNGASLAELETWLRQLPDVAMVGRGDVSVLFRLKDGMPLMFYNSTLNPVEAAPAATTVFAGKQRQRATRSSPSWLQNVVAGEGGRRKSPAYSKRALLLGAFEWERDSGVDTAKAMLETVRDYTNAAGGFNTTPQIVVKKNDEVNLDAFRGWEEFDLIYMVTHGGTFTSFDSVMGQDVSFEVIATGIEVDGDCSEVLAVRGVTCATILTNDGEKNYLALFHTWFKDTYPSGLGKTIVFLGGCDSFTADYLPKSIAGNSLDSVYLGWNALVEVNHNRAVALQFVDHLTRGLHSFDAYELLGADRRDPTISGYNAYLNYMGQPGQALRAREVITALDPNKNAPNTDGSDDLEDGDPARLEDSNKVLPYAVWVEGVRREDFGDYIVNIEVNGQAAASNLGLNEATQFGSYGYLLRGKADLPFTVAPGEDVEVKYIVELPEGGESAHEVTLGTGAWTLTVNGPVFGGTYEGTLGVFSQLGNASGVVLRGSTDSRFGLISISIPFPNVTITEEGFSAPTDALVALMPALGEEGPSVSLQSGDGTTVVEFGLEPPFVEPPPPTVNAKRVESAEGASLDGSLRGTLFSCNIFAPDTDLVCGQFGIDVSFEVPLQE